MTISVYYWRNINPQLYYNIRQKIMCMHVVTNAVSLAIFKRLSWVSTWWNDFVLEPGNKPKVHATYQRYTEYTIYTHNILKIYPIYKKIYNLHLFTAHLFICTPVYLQTFCTRSTTSNSYFYFCLCTWTIHSTSLLRWIKYILSYLNIRCIDTYIILDTHTLQYLHTINWRYI